MLKVKKLAGVAVLIAVVAALGLSSIASAQTATPPTTSTVPQAQVQSGPRPGGMMLHNPVELAAAAKALGMTTDELSAQLWGGKTLSDLATAKGIDIAVVQKAVQAAMIADAKTNLAQAVKDGKLTQAKADWLTQGLDKGYWGPGAAQDGFGFGAGPMGGQMGGPGGRDGGPRGGQGGPNGQRPGNGGPNNTAPSAPSTAN